MRVTRSETLGELPEHGSLLNSDALQERRSKALEPAASPRLGGSALYSCTPRETLPPSSYLASRMLMFLSWSWTSEFIQSTEEICSAWGARMDPNFRLVYLFQERSVPCFMNQFTER
ncbi:unnamed protein product [Arctogadus glacialis]